MSVAIEPTPGIRHIRTPEGITLGFEIAGAGDRLAALILDLVIVLAATTLLLVAALFAVAGETSRAAGALFLLLSFVIRNFYFTIAELRGSGTTIGKRRLGLRVISRDGGPLTPSAVFARNLTREIEIFLPVTALLQPQLLLPGLPGWGAVIGLLWLGVFALLPLFNRERLRIGDLLAGTIVVRMPRTRLLDDVAETADMRAATGVTPAELYTFTPEQLDVYGIRELQVLERVLRRAWDPKEHEVLETVAETIRTKIGWPHERVEAWAFLSSFYKAQRARLEHHMLFGDRRERKRE